MKLIDFATTDRQREYLEAVEANGGSQTKAAKQIGISNRTIHSTLGRLKKKAAEQGWAPSYDLTHPVPPGYHVKGVSTLYDSETGLPKIQWVKTDKDKEQQLELLREAVDSIADNVKVRKKIKAPKTTNNDLMVVYPMGDPHIGMYAWYKETGKDFNCDIARDELFEATKYLSEAVPAAATAVIINLGDFFHMDSTANTTARSNNQLDVDTRWPRVLELGVLAMIDCIELALEKHKKVIVFNEIGNHDQHTSTMLSICLNAWFRINNRVEIMDTAPRHDYYRFGKVLIGTTHGDTVTKNQRRDLAALMATDRPADWAASTQRYWYTGHIHSSNKEELVGCMWESFRNLAPNDNWHQGQGYRSGQDMCAIVHHKDHGEVSRVTFDISMLEAL